MRISRIAGAALIFAGTAVLVWGGNFTSRREVLEVGGLTVSAEERRPIAPWAAVAVLVAGVTLIVVDLRHKAWRADAR